MTRKLYAKIYRSTATVPEYPIVYWLLILSDRHVQHRTLNMQLVSYCRGKNLRLWVYIDPANGLPGH